ncbi:tetratricopeptide repeat protein [Halovulum sp. GXIMD14794]
MTATTATGTLTGREKRRALRRALADDHFAGAERLRKFLIYIVEQEIAGRGDAIRGKTIAQDVYDRTPDDGSDPENVVRVDARRLRQLLELHYETGGQGEPVRIHLDTGTYRPRFETTGKAETPVALRFLKMASLPTATFAIGGLAGGLIGAMMAPAPPATVAPEPVSAERGMLIEEVRRDAILEKSPAALRAVNLADEARSMIFPIFDPARQEMILSVFQRAIALDPDYHGGYAGAAQTLGTLAMISRPGEKREAYATAARAMADDAMRRDPASAWTQSALAWAVLATGDRDEAIRLSRRATELAPQDGNVLDFHGAVSLFTGNFAEAIRAADRDHDRGGSNQRFANRNILGAASLHLGNYRQSYEAFVEASRYGDPLSAPSLAYQAAALTALGETEKAGQVLAELERAWPNARIDVMLRGIYGNETLADDVLTRLETLGWRAEGTGE